MVKAAPTIQFNRAQPTGEGEPSPADLEATLDWLRSNGSPAWALQLPEALGDPGGTLARHGLAAQGSWTKFVRGTSDPPAARTSLLLRRIGPEHAADFARVVRIAFGAPPPFDAWIAALPGLPGWTTYLALREGEPVAAASLVVAGDTAWLGMGCTLPDHRGLGAQSALLALRLADAKAQGATLAVTETGTPGPGDLDRHPSFRNIGRAGFVPLYRRTNWRPAAGG